MQLSEESANDQLKIFLDYYDINIELFEGNIRSGMNMAFAKIINGIRKGKLEITEKDDGISVIQTLRNGEKITYAEISGRHKISMGDKEEYGKIYALMGSLSGLGEKAISSFKGADLGLVECLGTLYIQI